MYTQLHRPFFMLAPMYEVTDTVFRQIIADLAPPDLFVTEFVNVDGLQSSGRHDLLKRLRFSPHEKPIIAQIWGTDPANYSKVAGELVEMGFDGIDINMGCPDRTIVRRGCCSGLIQHREHAVAIIKATQEGAAGRLPISVKTRLGFGEIDYTWHELLLKQDLNMLSIHGRTTRQMSRGAADWEAIGVIRALRDRIAPQTLIVGNGDIMSHQDGLDMVTRHGLDGIMIGRGIFQDPFIFADGSPWTTHTKAQRLELYLRHVQLFAETWQHDERPIATLNKFCKVYIQSFEGAKELRDRLMHAESTVELIKLLTEELAKDNI
jgi:tRNA-dihydrouridine synthase